MGLTSQAGQINPQPVVATLYREGVRFALDVPVLGEDDAVGVPEIGGEDEVIVVRKLRIQTLGRVGATIPQCPAQDALGSTINSPPEPAGSFFLAIYVHNSSASTHVTSAAGTGASTLPATACFTQFITEL